MKKLHFVSLVILSILILSSYLFAQKVIEFPKSDSEKSKSTEGIIIIEMPKSDISTPKPEEGIAVQPVGTPEQYLEMLKAANGFESIQIKYKNLNLNDIKIVIGKGVKGEDTTWVIAPIGKFSLEGLKNMKWEPKFVTRYEGNAMVISLRRISSNNYTTRFENADGGLFTFGQQQSNGKLTKKENKWCEVIFEKELFCLEMEGEL